jgi:hemerythrin
MSIEWRDSYKIGNAGIEAQHQELFKHINLFLEASGKENLSGCAMGLYRYTIEHFKQEEDLKLQFHSPAIAAYVEQHLDLISRLNEISSGIASDTLNMKDLGSFLSDWLLGHIRIYDRKLAEYVQKPVS